MQFGHLNNFATEVAVSLIAGATSLEIIAGGENFADASATKQYALTLAERDIRGRDIRREIVYVTGRVANVLTVIRGREGTSDQGWLVGAPVEARTTAGVLANKSSADDIGQAITDHEAAADPHTQYDLSIVDITYSREIAILSDPIDLTTAGAAVTVNMPAGHRIFLSAIDVVIAGSDTPGGTPSVEAGPDGVTPAAYLANSPVVGALVGDRDVFTPAVTSGVTAVRVAVATAGTGTTFQARAMLRGYLLEI